MGILQRMAGYELPDFISLRSDDSPPMPIIFNKKSPVSLHSTALKPFLGEIFTFN